MIELQGKNGTARVFTDNIEQTAISQIIELMNQPFAKGSKVRVMPDVHAGKGCVIGFTAYLGDKVVPNLVGVDIGCGMFVVEIGKRYVNLEKVDNVVRSLVPSGHNIHDVAVQKFDELKNLYCARDLRDNGKFNKSIGTLGGGNHFIEVDEDNSGNLYLVIHSGSRNLGKQVAEHYQKMAIESCKGLGNISEEKERLIKLYKETGKKQMIANALKKMEFEFYSTQPSYPRELCFLTGKERDMYLNDMYKCQDYAVLNRVTMAKIILDGLGMDLDDFYNFHTIHNYIDPEDGIIRKGAVKANRGQELIIPMNMRDGAIIAVGKGNSDWNNSAPHGAGRLMGRNEAKRLLNMGDYENDMKGIYTTSVNSSTLDESPRAYKPMQEIISNIGDTVEIQKIIKPVYNYKDGKDL